MINWLHSRIFRPERGWDPVSEDYFIQYAEAAWANGADQGVIDTLQEWLGGLSGKAILDLGGGPGQYAVAFAKRGAAVTWHDVSSRYRQFAMDKAAEVGVDINFSLGYMDEAPRSIGRQ